jgi:mRNA-degrading endonuclease RelE of RelBE toxin-antitoxin system
MAANWKVDVMKRAKKQLDRLGDREREACITELQDMEGGYFGDAAPLRGHRNYQRSKFYRRAYRIIYRINRRDRRILVTRIVRRDEQTYKGFNPA